MIKSPCINICNGPLTTDGICRGCFRSISELEEWIRASDWRRIQILDECKKREKECEK
jgi:predicted Fe-S protein YdhL (DUF1289 family)